ncbi:FKBP-type peptidyl-prolyl cis-trans isomerase [Aliikangiella sp. IMCC44359]|uniref:FKBP-type peptidyl-prolyl cis-trans isomerase n=1 Tax=Aliikangiella sp. IMCC44359 TaxID=3459125 RepID=UPI00403AFC61
MEQQSADCLFSVKVTSLIAGLTEAILKMKVGDRWEMTIPPGLAYGPSKHGIIPANSVLIYQLELVKIH